MSLTSSRQQQNRSKAPNTGLTPRRKRGVNADPQQHPLLTGCSSPDIGIDGWTARCSHVRRQRNSRAHPQSDHGRNVTYHITSITRRHNASSRHVTHIHTLQCGNTTDDEGRRTNDNEVRQRTTERQRSSTTNERTTTTFDDERTTTKFDNEVRRRTHNNEVRRRTNERTTTKFDDERTNERQRSSTTNERKNDNEVRRRTNERQRSSTTKFDNEVRQRSSTTKFDNEVRRRTHSVNELPPSLPQSPTRAVARCRAAVSSLLFVTLRRRVVVGRSLFVVRCSLVVGRWLLLV